MFPYKFNLGQIIRTAVTGLNASRLFIADYNFGGGNVAAASDTGVHAAVTLHETDPTVVTTGISNPAVPRALRVKGNQAGVTGDVVIAGTNIAGAAISETIALNAGNAVEGTKAFKTVTSITLPARAGEGDTVSVGWNDKLGLPYMLSKNTVLYAYLDGAREATAPTVTVDDNEIEKNTVDLSSSLNNKPVRVVLLVP